jgi:hypothetical protein
MKLLCTSNMMIEVSLILLWCATICAGQTSNETPANAAAPKVEIATTQTALREQLEGVKRTIEEASQRERPLRDAQQKFDQSLQRLKTAAPNLNKQVTQIEAKLSGVKQIRTDSDTIVIDLKGLNDAFTSPFSDLLSVSSPVELGGSRDVNDVLSDLNTVIRDSLADRPLREANKLLPNPFGEQKTTAISKTTFIQILKAYSDDKFDSTRQKILPLASKASDELKRRADKAKQDLDAANALKNQIVERIDAGTNLINGVSIRLGLPLFCGTAVLLFLGSQYFRSRLAARGDDTFFSSSVLIELITVLLMTMTILILGLADKIKGDILGTLLGGISGYVLNRISRSQGDTEAKSKTSG